MRARHSAPFGLARFRKQNSFAQILTTFELWLEWLDWVLPLKNSRVLLAS